MNDIGPIFSAPCDIQRFANDWLRYTDRWHSQGRIGHSLEELWSLSSKGGSDVLLSLLASPSRRTGLAFPPEYLLFRSAR
jgi:hypothetical protein